MYFLSLHTIHSLLVQLLQLNFFSCHYCEQVHVGIWEFVSGHTRTIFYKECYILTDSQSEVCSKWNCKKTVELLSQELSVCFPVVLVKNISVHNNVDIACKFLFTCKITNMDSGGTGQNFTICQEQ